MDTGSTDGTWEYLQQAQQKFPNKLIIAQQIFDFFRFDVARNASLTLLPNDVQWALFLDIDEYLSEGWYPALQVEINKLNPDLKTSAVLINLPYIDYRDNQLFRQSLSCSLHSLGNKRPWVWTGAVHETLKVSNPALSLQTEIFNQPQIIHTPKTEKEFVLKKNSFYESLLELRYQENPRDFGTLYMQLYTLFQNDFVKETPFSLKQKIDNLIISSQEQHLGGRDFEVLVAFCQFIYINDLKFSKETLDELKTLFNIILMLPGPLSEDHQKKLNQLILNFKQFSGFEQIQKFLK